MLAIIPARGGSKGVPGKNIRELCGKPLITYTIEAALASRHISRVILSSDDPQIAEVAVTVGAEVPFMRPGHLATDTALAIDTYLYTLERLESQGQRYDEFVVLQPTSPLRKPADIDGGIELFQQKTADSVIGVVALEHPPEWMLSLDEAGRLQHYLEQPTELQNRQQYQSAYLPNGALFVLRRELIERQKSYYSDTTYGFPMPPERSVDIDSLADFEYAEYLMRKSCLT